MIQNIFVNSFFMKKVAIYSIIGLCTGMFLFLSIKVVSTGHIVLKNSGIYIMSSMSIICGIFIAIANLCYEILMDKKLNNLLKYLSGIFFGIFFYSAWVSQWNDISEIYIPATIVGSLNGLIIVAISNKLNI